MITVVGVKRMIDEKKLIGEIHKYFCDRIDEDDGEFIDNKWLKLNKEVCGIIYKQPKIGGWIPCSERFPTEEEAYDYDDEDGVYVPSELIVMVKGADLPTVAFFEDGEFTCGEFFELHGEVIAWQPLPEPYREEE